MRLVMTPETVVLAETRRTWTSLALHGFRVDGVVANRRVPTAPRRLASAGWARRAARRAGGGRGRRSTRCRVQRAGYADEEPVGVDALAALGERLLRAGRVWSARPDVLARRPRPGGLDVEREGGGFVLGLRVPLAGRDELRARPPRRRPGRHRVRAAPGAAPCPARCAAARWPVPRCATAGLRSGSSRTPPCGGPV